MGTDKVKEYLANFGLADRVMEFKESSATVAEAAADLGCEPARIGKTMAFDVAGQPMLVVIAGDGKVDNAKYKAKFHCKACMIKPDELVVKVGHPMGGVCPFAVCPGVPVYLDESLRRFDIVYPPPSPCRFRGAPGGAGAGTCRRKLFRLGGYCQGLAGVNPPPVKNPIFAHFTLYKIHTNIKTATPAAWHDTAGVAVIYGR